MGQRVGIVAADDHDLRSLREFACESLISFATSEWLRIAPDFVHDLELLVQSLGPGISLGEAFLESRSEVPRVSVPGPIPSASPSPAPSPGPSVPPLLPHAPSSGSGISHPIPRKSDRKSKSAARAAHQLPPTHPTSDIVNPSPATATRHRVALPRSAVHAVALATTPPAASTRSKKGLAVDLIPGDRPEGWKTCTQCKRQRKRCAPPKGAKPPFTSCAWCLRNKVECVQVVVAAGAY